MQLEFFWFRDSGSLEFYSIHTQENGLKSSEFCFSSNSLNFYENCYLILITIVITCSPCAIHCTQHFTYIISFHTHNKSVKWVLLWFSFDLEGPWDTEIRWLAQCCTVNSHSRWQGQVMNPGSLTQEPMVWTPEPTRRDLSSIPSICQRNYRRCLDQTGQSVPFK